MNITSTKLFQPRFHLTPQTGGRARVVNTTGDWVDPASTLVVPKSLARIGRDEKGQEFVQVPHQGQEHWVPKESFQDLDGKDGVYYLPTFRNSANQAAIGGASKAVIALGPLGLVSGGAAGYAAHKLGGNSLSKLAIGAGVGAVSLAAVNTAFYGPAGLPISLLLGAAAGLSAVHAGEGSSEIRDASYGGSISGFAVGALSGNPFALLTASAASGIGAGANHPAMKALVGGAVGAALGGAQALLTGQPVAMLAGLTALAGAAGPLIGAPVMQVTRNLSQIGGQQVAKALEKAPDSVLKVAGAVPYAAGFGFTGALAGAIVPGAGTACAVVGALGGAAWGYHQMSGLMEQKKAVAS